MAARAEWHPERPALRYTNVAILLHWLIAAMILFNLATGLFTGAFPRGIMAIHISSGISILVLTIIRIVWRLTHRPPPHPEGMVAWERGLAHVVHFALYAAMLLMPLSGWAMISANPPAGSPGAAAAESMRAPPPAGAPMSAPRPHGPPKIWGIVPLPLIAPLQEMGRSPEGLPAQKEKHEQIESFHAIGGYILLLLLVLHVAGALKHQFVDRQRELARMGIGRT